MDPLSNPNIFLLIIAAGAITLLAILLILRKKIGIGKSGTRDCPHCKQMIPATATECDLCLRKVVFV